MTEHDEHNDSLEEYEEFGDSELGDDLHHKPPGIKEKLADLWHNNPAFKVGVIGAAVLAFGTGTYAFMNNSAPKSTIPGTTESHVSQGETVRGTVGGNVSPEYQHALQDSNKEREQKALQDHTSAIPTPVGNITSLEPPKKETPADPLAMWKQAETPKSVVPPLQPSLDNQAQAQQQKDQQHQNDVNAVAGEMQGQISSLMQAWSPTPATVVSFNTQNQAAPGGATAAAAAATGQTAAATTTQPAPQAKVIVPAGDILYGAMITEANSDVPGPILAQILSGPLKGGRLIGNFQVSSDDFLVMQFHVLSINGHTYAINALALDPNTTLGGMATETDQRYFGRLILPAAAAFVAQFGQAISQPPTTTTVSNGTVVTTQGQSSATDAAYAGAGQSAQQLSNFISAQASTIKPLVRVASNTPIGIFFTSPVTDQPQDHLP